MDGPAEGVALRASLELLLGNEVGALADFWLKGECSPCVSDGATEGLAFGAVLVLLAGNEVDPALGAILGAGLEYILFEGLALGPAVGLLLGIEIIPELGA